ncbi:hypothetical protein IWQ61_008625 [Dispira simplex]|nr:hypothetical protein IWQ61_008625 [Dispira simplex]
MQRRTSNKPSRFQTRIQFGLGMPSPITRRPMSGPSGTLVSRNVFGEPDDYPAVATADSSIGQEGLRNTVTVIDVPNQSSSTQPNEIAKNDTDKGEVDPLEAFMQDIDGQVQAAKVHTKGAPKVGFVGI